MNELICDVVVIGGGIAGIQASLDLANMNYRVILLESSPSIGGKMILLSKTFPTLDCASCIATPRMAECAHHPNIKIITYLEVVSLDKQDRSFEIKIVKKPRYVDETKCIGCGRCSEVCPIEIPNEYEGGLVPRKAIYIPFPNALPNVALIDRENCIECGACERICPVKAIDRDQKQEEILIKARAIIIATGLEFIDYLKKVEYGRGKYINVLSSYQFERILNATHPYGHILRPSDGKIPRNIGYVLCVGSRDLSWGVKYCSAVCCMYSIKHAVMALHHLHDAEITIYYMDIRTYGKGFEEFYNRAVKEGVKFVRGKVAKIEEDPKTKDLFVYLENFDTGKVEVRRHDLVVLAVSIVPTIKDPALFKVKLNEYGFIERTLIDADPAFTSIDGIFVAGTAAGPMDIPDTITSASAAAMKASLYIEEGEKYER